MSPAMTANLDDEMARIEPPLSWIAAACQSLVRACTPVGGESSAGRDEDEARSLTAYGLN